ncbi:hypothetical protein QOT17_001296 [Balamuthia mandrillaris]
MDGEGNVLTQTMLHELEIWKKKHSMNFPVLYDENHKVASRLDGDFTIAHAYGVRKALVSFGEKTFGNQKKTYMRLEKGNGYTMQNVEVTSNFNAQRVGKEQVSGCQVVMSDTFRVQMVHPT